MKQKKAIFLLVLMATLILSCKKESSPTPGPIQITSGTNSQGYTAEVYSFTDIYLDGLSPSTNYNLAIFYGSTPTSSAVPSVDAGIVTINSITLKKDNSISSPGPNYIDTTNAITGNLHQINVSGSNQFPAGTLQYGQNYPLLTDTSLIPSTVQLSSGLSIIFHNCLHADSAAVTFDDNNGHSFSKRYGITNNQLNLSATSTQFNGFISGSSGAINIDLVNIVITPVGTKNYLVILEKRYNKLNVQFN